MIPRVTRLTPIDALAGGAGIDLTGAVRITNGAYTADVDLSEAQTVQDIINAVNNAGVFVLARVNEDGTGIDVFNQVSGSPLSIGENRLMLLCKGRGKLNRCHIRFSVAARPCRDQAQP